MRKHRIAWCVPVTEALDKAVEEAVLRDFHVSKADLIREAVREKLSKMNPPEQGKKLKEG